VAQTGQWDSGERLLEIAATLDHTAFMLILPPERWFGFLVVGCVLAMFFFPLAHGNFQSTHGPTTEFRAGRLMLGVIYSILCAVLLAFAGALSASRALLSKFALGRGQWMGPGLLLPSVVILRC
jgi:hypothetical protein